MKSRLLYHKFLQAQGFTNIIDPPYVHSESKILTIVFIGLLLFLIFVYNILKKIVVGYLETSPQAKTSTLLKSQEPESGSFDDPDQDINQEDFLNTNRNRNITDLPNSIIQNGKSLIDPLIKFANRATNPSPRLD